MEWYWAWYVLGPDTNTGNTMMTPSLFCPPVWISKGGIKKNSQNIFFKFSPNLFRKAVYIDKGWAVTFSWYLPMSLSDFTPALVWWVDYTMKANDCPRYWLLGDSDSVGVGAHVSPPRFSFCIFPSAFSLPLFSVIGVERDILEKKITQITIIYNGDSNQIMITKNHQKSWFSIKWSPIINTLPIHYLLYQPYFYSVRRFGHGANHAASTLFLFVPPLRSRREPRGTFFLLSPLFWSGVRDCELISRRERDVIQALFFHIFFICM